MEFNFLPPDVVVTPPEKADATVLWRPGDAYSNGTAYAGSAVKALVDDAEDYAQTLHPVDRNRAEAWRDSEMPPLEILSEINRTSAEIFTFQPNEPDNAHNKISMTIKSGYGDCDDIARRNYALAVASGIDPKNLSIGFGQADLDYTLASGEKIHASEGHVTLLYQDPATNRTYIVDSNFRDPIALEPSTAQEQNDYIGGNLKGNAAYIDVSGILGRDIEAPVLSGRFNLAPDSFYTSGQTIIIQPVNNASSAEAANNPSVSVPHAPPNLVPSI
jgi:hypothetical protein